MPRADHRDDWDDRSDDDRPLRGGAKPGFGGTLLAACGFGLTLIVGGVIGFAAGRAPREVEKPRSLELAENTPPVVKPPVVEPPTSTPTPTPKPEVKKPVVKKPEPEKPDPEPEPKKPDPKPPAPPKVVVPFPGAKVLFTKDVLPIFKAKCNQCHGEVGNPKGDLDLRTLAMALRGGDNGTGAKPGKPDDSQIWLSIDSGAMPPAGKEKLTAAEMKTVKNWILTGAK